MSLLSLLLFSICITQIFGQCPFGVWDYKNPDVDWPLLLCNQSCAGSLQSPVDIASVVNTLSPLNLTGYDDADVTLSNKGYTIEVEFPEDYIGFFMPDYNIVQFHFHTLSENSKFEKQTPLTMHIVHRNSKLSPPGLAVLTILWDIADDENPWLVPITDQLSKVTNASTSTAISLGGISSLVNEMKNAGMDHYVNFKGSLTVPPCTEGVDWYVFLNPLHMSFTQWYKLNRIMGSNYRPVQRTLYNVSAYIPQAQAPQPNPLPAQIPLPVPLAPMPSTPTPSPQPFYKFIFDNTYSDAFWVVFALLILTCIALCITCVKLRRASKPVTVVT